MTLHLVLTEHWFDETKSGHKRTEYRAMSDHWQRLIWERREQLKHVKFQRAFAKNPQRMTFDISNIDIGPCPIPGWSGEYYRIHFK